MGLTAALAGGADPVSVAAVINPSTLADSFMCSYSAGADGGW